MLCLVSESKEATSRIAEVLELMSAHVHRQVLSIVCVFVFTFLVRKKAQKAIRLLKHQCFLYMYVVPQTGGHEFYLAAPSSRKTPGSQSANIHTHIV